MSDKANPCRVQDGTSSMTFGELMTNTENTDKPSHQNLTNQICSYKEGRLFAIVKVIEQITENNYVHAKLEILAVSDRGGETRHAIGDRFTVEWSVAYGPYGNMAFFMRPLKVYNAEDAILKVDPEGRYNWKTS